MKRKRMLILLLAAACYFFAIFRSFGIGYADGIDLIRIGIFIDVEQVHISTPFGFTLIDKASGETLGNVPGGEEITFSAAGSQVKINQLGVIASIVQVIPLALSEDNYLRIGSMERSFRYRGIAEIRINNGKVTVINELPIEEYLLGVVPREMSDGYPIEALKAQAVAARTYALRNLGKHGAKGYDLCNTQDCQVYGGVDSEGPNATRAVMETVGQVARYNGKMISTFYFSSSGGHTENVENVWGYPLPYLLGVPDFDQDSPNYRWRVELTPAEIQKKIELTGKYSIGDFYGLEVSQVGVSGRIVKANLKGSKGQAEIKGEQLRSLLGLKSTLVTIEEQKAGKGEFRHAWKSSDSVAILTNGGKKAYKVLSGAVAVNGNQEKVEIANYTALGIRELPAMFIFSGGGWGHGVGMSQWGARNMAKQGYNYQEILKHYYTGITIEN